LIATLADDDPTSPFSISVPSLLPAFVDNREVAPPAAKVDTTTMADDDPCIMATAAVTTSSPTWHDWSKKQVPHRTSKIFATENQPESREIISVRTFNGENDRIDPMVYPSHQENNFQECVFALRGINVEQKICIGPRVQNITCAMDRDGENIPNWYKNRVDKHASTQSDPYLEAGQPSSTRAPIGETQWTSDVPIPWKRDSLKSEENFDISSEMALTEGECKTRI
jgi:hypothetical protein